MDYNSKHKSSEIEALLDKVKSEAAIVYHGTADTTLELTPNVLHKWDSVSSLAFTLPDEADGMASRYEATFTVGPDFSLSVPLKLRWANGTVPEFKEGWQCELSIKDDRILAAMFPAAIPDGELLEYIENDGADYIFTDILMNDNMYGVRIKSAALFDSGQASTYAVAGTRPVTLSEPDTPFFLWYLAGTQGRNIYWNGKRNAMGAFVKDTAYIDTITGVKNTVVSEFPLIVFGGNNVGTPTYNNKFRLYFLEFLDADGNSIVDLRPFRRTSDNAIGLLDTVSGYFYPSVNGAMIAPEPVDGEYLEYIESDGSDHIITDYAMSKYDCGYEVKASIVTPNNTYGCLCGTSTSSTQATSSFGLWVQKSDLAVFDYWDGGKHTQGFAFENDVITYSSQHGALESVFAPYPLAVFQCNASSPNASNRASGRIYYIKLLNANGEPNLHLRPFRRRSDGAIGMIDEVSGRFYASVNGSLTAPTE